MRLFANFVLFFSAVNGLTCNWFVDILHGEPKEDAKAIDEVAKGLERWGFRKLGYNKDENCNTYTYCRMELMWFHNEERDYIFALNECHPKGLPGNKNCSMTITDGYVSGYTQNVWACHCKTDMCVSPERANTEWKRVFGTKVAEAERIREESKTLPPPPTPAQMPVTGKKSDVKCRTYQKAYINGELTIDKDTYVQYCPACAMNVYRHDQDGVGVMHGFYIKCAEVDYPGEKCMKDEKGFDQSVICYCHTEYCFTPETGDKAVEEYINYGKITSVGGGYNPSGYNDNGGGFNANNPNGGSGGYYGPAYYSPASIVSTDSVLFIAIISIYSL